MTRFHSDLPQLADAAKVSPDPKTWQCGACDKRENLWVRVVRGASLSAAAEGVVVTEGDSHRRSQLQRESVAEIETVAETVTVQRLRKDGCRDVTRALFCPRCLLFAAEPVGRVHRLRSSNV